MTLSVTNQFINCSPVVCLARMKDATNKSIERIEQHATVENELVAAAGVIKALCSFIGGFIKAYPPAAMALSGVATVLPVRPPFT